VLTAPRGCSKGAISGVWAKGTSPSGGAGCAALGVSTCGKPPQPFGVGGAACACETMPPPCGCQAEFCCNEPSPADGTTLLGNELVGASPGTLPTMAAPTALGGVVASTNLCCSTGPLCSAPASTGLLRASLTPPKATSRPMSRSTFAAAAGPDSAGDFLSASSGLEPTLRCGDAEAATAEGFADTISKARATSAARHFCNLRRTSTSECCGKAASAARIASSNIPGA